MPEAEHAITKRRPLFLLELNRSCFLSKQEDKRNEKKWILKKNEGNVNNTDNDSRARMRYLKRGIFSNPDSDRKLYFNELSHRLIPSLSFYIFAIISGLACGVAFMLNSKELIVLTLALIPFMGPFFGVSLSFTAGSFSFLWKSFLKFLLAVALFVLSAFGIGGIGPIYNRLSAEMIQYFSSVQTMIMIITAISAFLAVFYISNNPQQIPQALSNGAMFGILLPLGLAGYCLSLRMTAPLLSSLQCSLIYALIGLTAATLAFCIRRLFMPKAASLILTCLIFAACTVFLLDFFQVIQVDFSKRFQTAKESVIALVLQPTATPTMTPTHTATLTQTSTFTATFTSTNTLTPIPPTATFTPTQTPTNTATPTNTLTPIPPTSTATATNTPTKTSTPTRTLRPSKTPTITFTPSPTIIYGIVFVPNDVGLLVRERPGFGSNVMKSQNNGSLLEIIGDETQVADGMSWIHVRTNDGLEGWVSQSLLRTATPGPN